MSARWTEGASQGSAGRHHAIRGSAAAARVSSLLMSARFAVHVVCAQLRHRHLEEAGELEHGGVFLVPADIAAAVARTRLVDGAAAVLAEELAGAETGLDA